VRLAIASSGDDGVSKRPTLQKGAEHVRRRGYRLLRAVSGCAGLTPEGVYHKPERDPQIGHR